MSQQIEKMMVTLSSLHSGSGFQDNQEKLTPMLL